MEKSLNFQMRSAAYFTVVPWRHKVHYDLWMTEIKEEWRKSAERGGQIDEWGWCTRWTIKLGVRDRGSARQSSIVSGFTTVRTTRLSHKTPEICFWTSRTSTQGTNRHDARLQKDIRHKVGRGQYQSQILLIMSKKFGGPKMSLCLFRSRFKSWWLSICYHWLVWLWHEIYFIRHTIHCSNWNPISLNMTKVLQQSQCCGARRPGWTITRRFVFIKRLFKCWENSFFNNFADEEKVRDWSVILHECFCPDCYFLTAAFRAWGKTKAMDESGQVQQQTELKKKGSRKEVAEGWALFFFISSKFLLFR